MVLVGVGVKVMLLVGVESLQESLSKLLAASVNKKGIMLELAKAKG